MFHKAKKIHFLNGTRLEVLFQDGKIVEYDMADLFSKYPQLTQLKNRALFVSGKLSGQSGIIWNDDLDIETETIYTEGKIVRQESVPARYMVGNTVMEARCMAGLTQAELAAAVGMDQADISKIERGNANPSINTLERISNALGKKLTVQIS